MDVLGYSVLFIVINILDSGCVKIVLKFLKVGNILYM